MSAGPSPLETDERWMHHALALAERAQHEDDEIPVGAIVVGADGGVLGEGWNRNITESDPTAHAEVVAMREAGRRVGNHRLVGCTLYVTLEPCAMCAMALMHARFKRVVFGAFDPKTGASGSVVDLFGNAQLNHHTEVRGGVLADECGGLLREFFAERREQYRQRRPAAALPDAAAQPEPPDMPDILDMPDAIPAGEATEIVAPPDLP